MAHDSEGWSWWVGKDDERYTTECGSHDEARYIAREEYEGAFIVEAKKPENIALSGYFDADHFLERAEENAYDSHADPEGDAPVFDATPDQREDLQAVVRAAIDQWQAKHSLVFSGFLFSAARNQEWIDGPEDEG
ncbi:hypothetical protein [Roseinatronobacter sp.]